MKLGVVGKPNVGKSTFFQAVTNTAVDRAAYPFTTIDTNLGVCYVTTPCACQELSVSCSHEQCEDGIRFIPINILDVAGLVPGAAEGKGMGNQFLSNVAEASCLIQVVDMSGATNAHGEPTDDDHSPVDDMIFIADEVDEWLYGILTDNWESDMRKLQKEQRSFEAYLAEKLTGVGITRSQIQDALRYTSLSASSATWTEAEIRQFVSAIRATAKPFIYACNKMDANGAAAALQDIKSYYPEAVCVPMSAEMELALRNAAVSGIIDYLPGSATFSIEGSVSGEQKQALERIQEFLSHYNGTGVQEVVNQAVFDILHMIVVYPVDDATHFTDKNGTVLPDALLLPAGSTTLDVAYAIHSDIGDQFIKAIDAKTDRTIGKNQEVEHNSVISIAANT